MGGQVTEYIAVFERVGIAAMILVFLGFIVHKVINAYLPGYASARIEQVQAEAALARTAKDAIAKMPTTISEAIGSFNGKLSATEAGMRERMDSHARDILQAVRDKEQAGIEDRLRRLEQEAAARDKAAG